MGLFSNISRNLSNEDKWECLEISAIKLSAIKDDIYNQVTNGELSGKKKRKREVEIWLKEADKTDESCQEMKLHRRMGECDGQIEGPFERLFGGNAMDKLHSRVEKHIKERPDVRELLIDDFTCVDPLVTSQLIGKAFAKNLKEIVQRVTHKGSIIGIYGMGGVGKTTLAKHIHNILLNEPYELHVYWVTVSQDFNISKLQHDIAKQIGVDLSGEFDVVKRAAKLYRMLSEKKDFVLILDDVWDDICLEDIGVPVSEGARVVVTSRSFEVCRRVGCEKSFEVKTLEKEETWKLFRDKLGPSTTLSPQVEEIAKLIVGECDGLPLGIITIAGSMRGETDIDVWMDALTKLQSSRDVCDGWEDKVFRVLKYSFDRLDRQRQLCFLYCSLYPEDYPIDKTELIEKFIDEKKGRHAQFNEGHSILKKLENISLLEEAEDDGVKMHDLVRDMALKIAENSPKFKVFAGRSLKTIPEDWPEDVEKMSFMHTYIYEIPEGMSPNCPKLSTLLLKYAFCVERLPDLFFSGMLGLKVLDLSGNDEIQRLPDSLSELERLNSLILSGCINLSYVPNLGKLKELTELDISFCHSIEKVPEGMENLVKLKFLSFFRTNLKGFPTGLLPKFQHLQSLILPFTVNLAVEDINMLKKLEYFNGFLKDCCDLRQVVALLQNQKPTHSYDIRIGAEFDFDDYESNDEFSLGRSKLALYNCNNISSCFMDEFLELHLFILEKLRIRHCRGIECIWKWKSINSKKEGELMNMLSRLEEIQLDILEDMKSVIEWNDEVVVEAVSSSSVPLPHFPPIFSSLRRLKISCCKKMKKLGLRLADLQNIEEISIWRCEEIEEEEIEEIIQVGPETEATTLTKLVKLNLYDLPKLKSICEATLICDSLAEIELRKCRALKKLPLLQGTTCYPPPALRRFVLYEKDREWWDSLEWELPSYKDALQPLISWQKKYNSDLENVYSIK